MYNKHKIIEQARDIITPIDINAKPEIKELQRLVATYDSKIEKKDGNVKRVVAIIKDRIDKLIK